MNRVLLLSPHFPPDTSAGTHRVRLLAPHLPKHGWEPTVVTVDPAYYEGRLDPDLAALVPPELMVIRAKAWSRRWTRKLGFGDLGLRALTGLYGSCNRLMKDQKFDALYITIFPAYPAMLGPLLKRRFKIPFILDYQDPWVGAWGASVGGGRDRRPDAKSRTSRFIAAMLEPIAVSTADAITAVSAETYRQVQARNPATHDTLCAEIPLGGEPADFARSSHLPWQNQYFDPTDGNFHLCYVGTLLPLGIGTLEAFLRGLLLLRDRVPSLYSMVRLHFFGTSNQTIAGAPKMVIPLARALGLGECVTEIAERVDYLDALGILKDSSAILMLGSSERHYTASKVYPGLLARRPILAIFHEASGVSEVLGKVAREPTVNLVAFGNEWPGARVSEAVCARLASLIADPRYHAEDVDARALEEYSAATQAAKLAAVFDECVSRHAKRASKIRT